MSILRLIALCVGVLAVPLAAMADDADVVLLYRGTIDTRPLNHNEMVLEEALRRSVPRFGPYRLERRAQELARGRLLDEMRRGDLLNVTIVASQPEWESLMLPVWVPTDMGLSGFRIGLIRQDAQTTLSAVQDAAALKQLRVGVGAGWSSRKVLEANGYQLEMAKNQDALVRMLMADRLDYFPRGVNEVFVEYDRYIDDHPGLAVEKELVLITPLPTYIFVSPKAPRIAERLRAGMELMVRDGSLQRMVAANHADMLARANLCARRPIRIPNPMLSSDHPLNRPELWLDPYSPKSGLCARANKAAPLGGKP